MSSSLVKQRRTETLHNISSATGINMEKVLKAKYEDVFEIDNIFWVQFLSPFFAPIIILLGKTGSGKTALSLKLAEIFLDVHANSRVIFLSAPGLEKEIGDPRVIAVRDLITKYMFNEPELAEEYVAKIRDYLSDEESTEKDKSEIDKILEEIAEKGTENGFATTLFICDESMIEINNKDWSRSSSKMTEKFFAIKRHLSVTLVFISQTKKINSTAIEMSDFTIYKRCNKELIKKLERISDFVKEYKEWILTCPLNGFIIDDKNTAIDDDEMPQVGELTLPRNQLWSERISKIYSDVTFAEFVQMTSGGDSSDEERKKRKELKFTEEDSVLIMLEHCSHIRSRKVGKPFKIREIYNYFVSETKSEVSKQTVLNRYDLIKHFTDTYGCPICGKHDEEIQKEFKDMGYIEYKIKKNLNLKEYIEEDIQEAKKEEIEKTEIVEEIKTKIRIPKKIDKNI